MENVSGVELIVLRKMYPEGCRVVLEKMVNEPYAKLVPGDLGTVQHIDDAGGIHILWDSGSSVAILYKVDSCKCFMTKETMEDMLKQLQSMPFETMDKLQAWLEEKLLPIFPKMYFRTPVNGQLPVELGCTAFRFQNIKIIVGFTQDAQQHVYVEKCELRGNEISKNKRERNQNRH